MSALDVWMNGEYVARWSSNGSHSLEYSPDWLESERARPLSLSLPFTASRKVQGAVVENYFDNLLPDNEDIRKRIRARHGTKSLAAFELLTAIGRDCVGAAQILPVGETPVGFNEVNYQQLTEAEVELILRDVPTIPAYGQQDHDREFRISIAGTQEKTALLRIDGNWCRPLGATPTTHILKLPLGQIGGRYDLDLTTSIENEWLCGQILTVMGLRVCHSEMVRFGDQRALAVERFDRDWLTQPKTGERRWILRLPQEDLCQASGLPPGMKYEKDGGPGIARCLEVLGSSAQAVEDRGHFALTQLAFWLLAATDGHGKNFSIFLERGGRYRATPIYDVLSAWPVIGERAKKLPYRKATLAMALRSKNAHDGLSEVHARHWYELAQQTGGAPMWEAMVGMVERTADVLSSVERRLPRSFPSQVWDDVAKGMRKHQRTFLVGAREQAKGAD